MSGVNLYLMLVIETMTCVNLYLMLVIETMTGVNLYLMLVYNSNDMISLFGKIMLKLYAKCTFILNVEIFNISSIWE